MPRRSGRRPVVGRALLRMKRAEPPGVPVEHAVPLPSPEGAEIVS
ncbi:hypothetical protein PV682_27810 [Streptomyces niveiscabiei]|nr:hypothetical protein [Streptomyces niveiscabiei]MDX3385251.1 hypothetical protein [Streptomyces niveiscabiei]